MTGLSKFNGVTLTIFIAIGLMIILPIGYLYWFFLDNNQPLSLDSAIWGSFGDFFSGVMNPIIAFFAFYWLTRSVIMQRKELRATQDILVETEKAQRAQVVTQEKKRFEDTFYSLLSQMNIVHQGLNEEVILHNKKALSKIDTLHKCIVGGRHLESLSDKAQVMRDDQVCSHYFRILYQLLTFVLLNTRERAVIHSFESSITTDVADNEKMYTNIVRAFLDQTTIQLLAINCVQIGNDINFDRFKILIERYSLLEHLSTERFPWMEELKHVYDPSTFGSHPTMTS